MSARVDTAVILAAGMGSRLASEVDDRPKGMMVLGDKPIVEESLDKLVRAGVERVIVVTGHLSDAYEELARAHPGLVTTVHNPVYSTSGSMYSLYCARDLIEGDFLLLESDLIYEQRALTEALDGGSDSCILLSDWTRSGDEVYVSTRDGNLPIHQSSTNRIILVTLERSAATQ